VRTTLDIAIPVLRELKRLQKRNGKSLGNIASDLMAEALTRHRTDVRHGAWTWTAQRMGPPRVDLRDKEALRRALDPTHPGSGR
jgi:hypothetical protein